MSLSLPSIGFIVKVAVSLFIVSMIFKAVPQLGQFKSQILV